MSSYHFTDCSLFSTSLYAVKTGINKTLFVHYTLSIDMNKILMKKIKTDFESSWNSQNYIISILGAMFFSLASFTAYHDNFWALFFFWAVFFIPFFFGKAKIFISNIRTNIELDPPFWVWVFKKGGKSDARASWSRFIKLFIEKWLDNILYQWIRRRPFIWKNYFRVQNR